MQMRRRELITLVGGAVAAWPFATSAQQAAKMHVGYVTLQPRTSPEIVAFIERMRELGYEDGKNFAFDLVELRNPQETRQAYADLAARGCDILVATGSEVAMQAATQAAGGRLAIVFFALDYDPFEKGYVASLARPGGNSTGIFVRQIELAVKRVQLARVALRDARILALLWDLRSRDQAAAAAAAAREFGFEPRLIEASGQPPDYAAALALIADTQGAIILIPASPQFYRDRVALLGLLLGHRVPSIGALPEYAEAGALLSYGVGLVGVLQDVARYIDRIARGAKPADLPVEQPTHFELVVNLKTAKALGVEMPPTLLASADEVIE
jgi:putative tryptophan/tyrosine transport system substrate-binding protein